MSQEFRTEQMTNALGTATIEVPSKTFDPMLYAARSGDMHRPLSGIIGMGIIAIPIVFLCAYNKYSKR